MDIAEIAKLILAVAGILTGAKILYDIAVANKSNLREEYRFAREFLDDPQRQHLHPFTIARGYQAIAGTSIVKPWEIEYILSLENPIQCLNDFVLSKQLFRKQEADSEFRLVFRNGYQSPFSRSSKKYCYFVLYFVLALAAVSPLLLSISFNVKVSNPLILLLFTFPTFGFCAWTSMQAAAKVVRAEHLFDNQKKHTKAILNYEPLQSVSNRAYKGQ